VDHSSNAKFASSKRMAAHQTAVQAFVRSGAEQEIRMVSTCCEEMGAPISCETYWQQLSCGISSKIKQNDCMLSYIASKWRNATQRPQKRVDAVVLMGKKKERRITQEACRV
jgi:hypothetical protein